jgi:hypothetical protein
MRIQWYFSSAFIAEAQYIVSCVFHTLLVSGGFEDVGRRELRCVPRLGPAQIMDVHADSRGNFGIFPRRHPNQGMIPSANIISLHAIHRYFVIFVINDISFFVVIDF